jgi:hypothetical protein
MSMNPEQASRLLDVGFDFVAQYDNVGNHAASWRRTSQVSALPAWAAQQAAARATWGRSPGDALARQVAIDEIVGVLTVLIPIPGGGFIVGAIENWFLGRVAGELADRLEQAVKKEFGTNWAPLITVGIAAAVLFVATVPRTPS